MISLSDDPPALSDYLHLRAQAGLTPRTATEGGPALTGSWAWVTAHDDGSLVAMGRVIGDGGWYFVVADLATLPSHQGRGIGRAVLGRLLVRIHEAAPDAYVTLMADPPGQRLYRQLGFVETAPASVGMRLDRRQVTAAAGLRS